MVDRESGGRASTDTPLGTPRSALAHAWRLLPSRPNLAAEQANEILSVEPRAGAAWQVLGLARSALGDDRAAVEALRRAGDLAPTLPGVWRALGDALVRQGDPVAAGLAYLRHVDAAIDDPPLMQAAGALLDGRLDQAEALLRDRLRAHPTDVAAIRMLAELAARLGRYPDAEALLERALELAPGFDAARHNYALALHRRGKGAEALVEVGRLLADDPDNPGYRLLQAAALALTGDYDASLEIYERLLKGNGAQPKTWLSYGHALKTVGRGAEATAAYVRAADLQPTLGEAWFSLANMKTLRFDAAQVDAMRRALDTPGLQDEDRLHLHYALGKALEDGAGYDGAFDHYAAGAAIQKARLGYRAADTTRQVERIARSFSPELFARLEGLGDPSPDPIFVVGLPRSGSTLIEQILSSHPDVEGTMELPEIAAIARSIGEGRGEADDSYLDALPRLAGASLAQLGRRFLDRTRIQRKLNRAFFIDKMPNNWVHVGLIHLILPNARIVDARRHPMGACFSAFKQHFARGQGFSYGLDDLGRYYRDYVGLMAHFDAVLPGRVHRVIYEDMVEDTEGEVRRLLHHCGLTFDPACLRFYETERAVRTASSEQVRRPIFREGLEQWRRFEDRLDPLKAALGPVLDSYRDAPGAVRTN